MFFNPNHIVTSFLALCFAMGLVHEITDNPGSHKKYGNETEHNGHTDGPESDMDDMGHVKIFEVLGPWTKHFLPKKRFVLHFYRTRFLQLIGLSHPTPPPESFV